MDCKDYQDLIIQLPYNELDQEEVALLKTHLESCDKCTAALESNQQLFEFTKKLSASVPLDENRQTSITSILGEIESSKEIRNRKIISFRTLRFVTNAAAIFLISLFLLQQVDIRRNLEDLKVRIESQADPHSENSIPAEIEITSYLDNPTLLEQFNISEDQILEIIDNYQTIQEENTAILLYLQMNYPEVYNELQRKLKESKHPTRNL